MLSGLEGELSNRRMVPSPDTLGKRHWPTWPRMVNIALWGAQAVATWHMRYHVEPDMIALRM